MIQLHLQPHTIFMLTLFFSCCPQKSQYHIQPPSSKILFYKYILWLMRSLKEGVQGSIFVLLPIRNMQQKMLYKNRFVYSFLHPSHTCFSTCIRSDSLPPHPSIYKHFLLQSLLKETFYLLPFRPALGSQREWRMGTLQWPWAFV